MGYIGGGGDGGEFEFEEEDLRITEPLDVIGLDM